MKTEAKVGLLVVLVAVIAAAIYFASPKENIPLGTNEGGKKTPGSIPLVDQGGKVSPPRPVRPLSSGPAAMFSGRFSGTQPTTQASTQPVTTRRVDLTVSPNKAIRLDDIESTTQPFGRPAGEQAKVHIVKPGDSLFAIAQQYYGRGELYVIIKRANPQVDERRLTIGQKIIIPPTSEAEWQFDAPAELPAGMNKESVRAYTVKPGETFSSIARDQLGSEAQGERLFELNKSLVENGDPTRLRAGQTIFIPRK
jgi:nucleoid-associated protein YgaU